MKVSSLFTDASQLHGYHKRRVETEGKTGREGKKDLDGECLRMIW
jgi:hypothetical protein